MVVCVGGLLVWWSGVGCCGLLEPVAALWCWHCQLCEWAQLAPAKAAELSRVRHSNKSLMENPSEIMNYLHPDAVVVVDAVGVFTGNRVNHRTVGGLPAD